MTYPKGAKSAWVLILMMLAGVVIGGFIGKYAGMLPHMDWLNYGSDFGLTSPVIFDLGIIVIQFGLTLRFTICGIIGVVLAVFFYKTWD